MKVAINLELDYVLDKDVLFFLSHEPLITRCIKNMSMKKDKTDKANEDNFNVILNKGLVDNTEVEEIETTEENTNADNNLYIE